MLEITLKGRKLKMYESVQEMPIEVFQAYNLNLMLDAGIGSDMNAAAEHIAKIKTYVLRKEAEKANQQLDILYQNLAFVVSKSSPEMNSFVCLIASIDGKINSDLSEEGIKRTLKYLNKRGLTVGKIRSFLNGVKKKLKKNWQPSFPKSSRGKMMNTTCNWKDGQG